MRTALLVLVTVISLVAVPVPAASLAASSAAVRSAPSPTALTQVSSDPFTNSSTYHATEVEPDTYASASDKLFPSRSSTTTWRTPLL